MSKITQAFSEGPAFIPFITGGDPDLETTEKLLHALSEAGADLIEIGIPFSDPIAEGPVIEAADVRALNAGCTVDLLFDLVARARSALRVPLLFMTYYNPIFVYGADRFCARCAQCGIDGLIVPDLPFEERDELLGICKAHGLELISMIAPTSADERLEAIARGSSGFLYCVSSLGVTGERCELGDAARGMIEKVRQVSDIPCAVGFGVSTPEQAREIATFADGVIVGSAFVRLIAQQGQTCTESVARFARELKQAVSGR